MEPKMVVELTASGVFVIVLFASMFLLPSRRRLFGFTVVSILTIALIAFFTFRPLWYDFQYVKKSAILHSYLETQYPEEEWQITRRTGRHDNPNHLTVIFKNEPNWMYTYLVGRNRKICQIGWTPPEGDLPRSGLHYDKGTCR
ncbi:hypothetical protein [Neobacillus sp. YIM B06451]|uniref:hypothetical protein n=1 Tax=Neobacillus sp. YIM B06451 TaxID=3070994 RepID=UPI00292F730F|nr:hypothetical protein [Neobacillus sp. YIM B06451]